MDSSPRELNGRSLRFREAYEQTFRDFRGASLIAFRLELDHAWERQEAMERYGPTEQEEFRARHLAVQDRKLEADCLRLSPEELTWEIQRAKFEHFDPACVRIMEAVLQVKVGAQP